MKAFDSQKIKNVVLLGHSGAGKTTLTEDMLFEAGVITRRGTVEERNTVSDYHDIEQERGNSMFDTLTHLEWKDNKINIIDTPGFDDFVGEVIAALRVADTGIMVINAQNGVEVGTEILWEYTEQFQTPMILAINHLDSDKANFDLAVEQARERFGSKVTLVQYPLNPGPGFNAIIDVLKMVMYKFPEGGGKPEKLPIPDAERAKADELHNALVEAIAVNDEGLMELFFEKGELSEEEMAKGMKASMIHHDIFPVFCTSGKKNMGSGRILGFIHDIAPASVDMPPARRKSGQSLLCDPNGPVCLFIFKTANEPNLGTMSFFKVFSGTINAGDDLINSETQTVERLGQLYILNGKNRTLVNTLAAGDIGATVKLKHSPTNSSLHEKNKPVRIQPIEFPEPRITVAVETDNKHDIERVAQAFIQFSHEDPTLILEHSKELKQMLLSAQGELHLTVAKWRVEHQLKTQIHYGEPRIPFRETIRQAARAQYRHKKQSGGAGQFAEVHLLVEPYYEGMPDPEGLNVRHREVHELEWGGRLEFFNCIVGGSIDARFMPSILKGVMECMFEGPITGSYVRDVRVSVYDGRMHSVDSNDMAFKLAGKYAFKAAFHDSSPLLLEPIYEVEVLSLGNNVGDVMSDLQTRRAIIMGIDTVGHYQKITAHVPLMELYKYASTLRALSQGAAKHQQRFFEYAAVPADIQRRLMDEYQKQAHHHAEE